MLQLSPSFALLRCVARPIASSRFIASRCIASAFESETKCTSVYLESSARRIGLSENRSSVCKPVNIVVAKPRVTRGKKRSIERKRNGGARRVDGWLKLRPGAKFFFPTGCRRCGSVNACLLAPLKWSVRYGGRIDCTRRETGEETLKPPSVTSCLLRSGSKLSFLSLSLSPPSFSYSLVSFLPRSLFRKQSVALLASHSFAD